ncbi:MAG TPA: zinc ribbon domain-containing protein [Candidatus Ratteibacteria bacterium]|nr:zinc ribbon domain-containing protein [Candidatus Ratteibacteria bacterium]
MDYQKQDKKESITEKIEEIQKEEQPTNFVCEFCHTPIEPGQIYCSECGNPTKKTVCPNCGNASYFDFCEICNMPLTPTAKEIVEKIKQDPEKQDLIEFIHVRSKDEIQKEKQLSKEKTALENVLEQKIKKEKEESQKMEITVETLTGNWSITDIYRTVEQYNGKISLFANDTFTLIEYLKWFSSRKTIYGKGIWSYNPETQYFQFKTIPGGCMIGKIEGTIDDFKINGYWSNGHRARTHWIREK